MLSVYRLWAFPVSKPVFWKVDIYNVVGETDLSENCVKSASKSHILSPERAALAEYTGPIPFFVVPRLSKAKRGGKETQRKEKQHLHAVLLRNMNSETVKSFHAMHSCTQMKKEQLSGSHKNKSSLRGF